MTEFAQLRGWRAGYDRVGEGAPLVLLHGESGRRQWCEPMLECGPDGYQWWLVDLPGHGESSATSGHYRLTDVATNLAEFLREVIGQPSVIYGHSYAGQVALVLTAEYPQLVRGLIIGDAPLSVGVQRTHMQANREMTTRWRALAASDAGIEELAAQLRRLRIRHPATGQLVKATDVFAEDHIWFSEVARSLVGHDPDFVDAVQDRFDDTFRDLIPSCLFPRCQCPVLLLRGDPAAGGLLTEEDVVAVLPLYDQIEVEQVHGVGHGLQLEAPQAVIHAIEPFLTKLRR